jgi:hypothetical protein
MGQCLEALTAVSKAVESVKLTNVESIYILDVVSLMDKEGRQLKVIGLVESSYKKGEDKSVNTGVLTTVLTTISIRKFSLIPYKGIFLIRKESI